MDRREAILYAMEEILRQDPYIDRFKAIQIAMAAADRFATEEGPIMPLMPPNFGRRSRKQGNMEESSHMIDGLPEPYKITVRRPSKEQQRQLGKLRVQYELRLLKAKELRRPLSPQDVLERTIYRRITDLLAARPQATIHEALDQALEELVPLVE